MKSKLSLGEYSCDFMTELSVIFGLFIYEYPRLIPFIFDFTFYNLFQFFIIAA
jgi:hypothetical protein